MMRPFRFVLPLLVTAIFAQSAAALIKVKTPVSEMYSGAVSVVVGKVTRVSPDTGVIEASAAALKGDGVGDTVKIKLENLPAVIRSVKEGSPVVLLIGRRSSSNALNLADSWLFPEAAPSAKSNFVVRKELDLKQSFPGSTAALVRALEDLKAGKSTMLDEVTPGMFKGAVKEIGSVPAGGAALYTVRPTGGKTQTIVLATPAGPKFFTADSTGLKPAQPVTDDRPKSPVPDAIAAAFGNFGEEPDKLYALVIKDDNIYRYPLDGQAAPADFLRLTGERISNYHKDNPKWLAGATAAALDCNGDGRMDLLINTPSGPLLLINRGFGAFFIDTDLAKVLKTPAGAPLLTDKTLWTAADVDGDGLGDLIIVSAETGAVTAVMNPKPEKKP
ncbi:MAG: hypothetical protein JWN40_4401 [Phycisphaerales bacterium]|nr:hypothetical protein [Phycisphaerales bacterium]